jgi:hypothetical protein
MQFLPQSLPDVLRDEFANFLGVSHPGWKPLMPAKHGFDQNTSVGFLASNASCWMFAGQLRRLE